MKTNGKKDQGVTLFNALDQQFRIPLSYSKRSVNPCLPAPPLHSPSPCSHTREGLQTGREDEQGWGGGAGTKCRGC